MRPNLFLVGAPKCATTSLHHYFSTHPDIFVSPLIKEYHHFNSDLTGGRSGIVVRAAYLEHFAAAVGKRYALDATPWYLYSAKAARDIFTFNPSARIIISLRDPIEQMASLHFQRLSTGNEVVREFSAALMLENERRAGRQIPVGAHLPKGLMYRDVARYSIQVQRFIEIFPRHQIYFLIHEELVADPAGEYRKLLAFLDLPSVLPASFQVYNASKEIRFSLLPQIVRGLRAVPVLRRAARAMLFDRERRILWMRWLQELNQRNAARPELPAALETSLRQEFREEIAALEALLERRLPWARG